MMTDVRPYFQAHEWHPHKNQIKTGNTGTSEPFKYDLTREAFRKERLFCMKCVSRRDAFREKMQLLHDNEYYAK